AGCAVLVLRPLLWQAAGHPTVSAVALFTALLLVGCRWPLTRADAGAARVPVALALVVGVGAFAVGRLVGGGHPPVPFAAALVGCGRAAGGPRTLTIGAVYPTTGPQGEGGTDELRGARLAVAWANAHGGVRGREVRLLVKDAERAEAVPEAMDALEADGVR